MTKKPYQIELANRIRRGRATRSRFVVTRRPPGDETLTKFASRQEAQAWLAEMVTR